MTAQAITAVLGGQKTLRRKVTSDEQLRMLTREGLPANALPTLAEKLAVEKRALAKVVGISERTLSRRLANHSRLSAEESDRMVRVARVMAHAIDTFGSETKASSWLRTPNLVLADQAPLDLLDTDAGVRQVETVLGRIEYGVYS
jgi:putative toxin-antitoxin system antitoxin component (TIGR02293 family)